MRTTVNLDDDVFKAAQAKAEFEDVSLGRALSALARQALSPQAPLVQKTKKGLPQFTLPRMITINADDVRAALDEEHD